MIQYKLLMTQFSLSSNHWIQNAPLNPLPTTLLCLAILFFFPLSPMYICMAILKAWLQMVTLALAGKSSTSTRLSSGDQEHEWAGGGVHWWGRGDDDGAGGGFVSYGALKKDKVPCNCRGHSYYNCRRRGKANPYRRGCSVVTKCKRFPNWRKMKKIMQNKNLGEKCGSFCMWSGLF